MSAFWLVYVAEQFSLNVRQHFWVLKTIASFRRYKVSVKMEAILHYN